METITRKTMLYKTGVEYGDYTMNHVEGCAHGCKYPCYAFQMKKRFGKVKTYEDWCQPKLVANTLELLDKEIPRLKDKIKSVHLCFSTDPFPYVDEDKKVALMSIEAIRKLNNAGIKCTMLTKGLLPYARLLDMNEYGISLVSLDEKFRKQYEPNTAPYAKRIERLKFLYNAGCKTWVSIEPYPTPNICDQDLEEILAEVRFVDKIVFGKWNYNKAVSDYPNHKNFYNAAAQTVIDFCLDNGIDYHIKRGTVTMPKLFDCKGKQLHIDDVVWIDDNSHDIHEKFSVVRFNRDSKCFELVDEHDFSQPYLNLNWHFSSGQTIPTLEIVEEAQ